MAVFPAAVSWPVPVLAHDGPAGPVWTEPAFVGVCLGLVAASYLHGLARLWRRGGSRSGVGKLHAGLFLGGLMLIAGLLLSPLDGLSRELLSAHMVQHFALMLIAAPMIVLGRPGVAFLWALPRRWRPPVTFAARYPAIWALSHPFAAWAVYLVVLWVWHAPPLHQAALRSEGLHAVQHAAFLGAALLFWNSVLASTRGEARASAFAAVFATAVQSCVLAALLTTSQVLWYPAYPGGHGLDAMQDQQLGGLVMWVPCCAILIGAALALLAQLLGDIERRAERLA